MFSISSLASELFSRSQACLLILLCWLLEGASVDFGYLRTMWMKMKVPEGASTVMCWVAIALWNLLVAIDATSISTALPTIANDLQMNSTQAFWLGTAFLLLATVMQPVFTSLSDAFGRKAVVLASLLLFTVGTVVCGWAGDVKDIIIGRCVQGAGAGGLLALSFVILCDLVPLHQRGNYIGLIGLVSTVGICSGPVIGGVLTDHSTWRWLFWFNLPCCGVCAVFVSLFHHRDLPKPKYVESLQRIDWSGMLLFIMSLTSVLFALSSGGMLFRWDDVGCIIPMVFGVVGLAVWAVYSLRMANWPMLPMSPLLTDRTNLITYLGTIVAGLIQAAAMYGLPIFYQAVKGYSASESGLGLLPMTVACGPGAMLSGFIAQRTQRAKFMTIVSWVLLTLGCGLLILFDQATSVGQWIGILIPGGFGFGLLFAPMTLTVHAMTEKLTARMDPIRAKRTQDAAAGLSPFFHTLGQAIGVMVAQSCFTNEVKRLLGMDISQDAVAMSQSLSLTPSSAAKDHVVSGINSSLTTLWIILTVFAGVWIIPTLFMKDVKLDNPLDTKADASEVSLPRSEHAIRHSEETVLDEKTWGKDVQVVVSSVSLEKGEK